MKTQLEIENENLQVMITKGINELQTAKENGTVSDLKISGAVIPYYVGDLANCLDTYAYSVLSGKAKIKALPAKMLTILDPRVVAHYTVKCVVDSVGSKKTSVVSIGKSLANYLETEYKVQLLEEKDPTVKAKFVDFIQSTNYVNKRQTQITNDLIKKYHKDIADTSLSFYKLAVKSITLLASTRPIVKNTIMPPLCFITEKLGIESSVEVASWFKEWLSEMLLRNDGQVLPEYHTPLIEKPIEWKGMFGGGFHTARFKYPLVKTEVDLTDYPKMSQRTLDAVNRLQATPWRVNKKVLDVMLACSENDLGWGDLPTVYNAKDYITPCPHSDISKEFLSVEQKEDRKLWRQQAAPHYSEQESRASKVLALKRVLIEANRFKDYESIYFAYFLDFRGRIYPKASNLQPQGTDFVKALLQFSVGKPIDNLMAEKYFFMHGANCFGHGLDKKTLDEKRAWVIQNSTGILNSAKNPYDQKGLWHQADEDPWLFLAFCFEYHDYIYDNKNFLSHMPIAFDGSCNGLQHLSAMLLDDVGGEAVNLTNKRSKQDIYDVVRVKTETLLKANSEPLASDLLKFGITRKACKRPVMIVPYAGTMRACRKYIEEQIIKEGAKEYFKDNFTEALSLYTSTVWQAIGLTIVGGREIMSFLGKFARMIVSRDDTTTITWTTPNGFMVKQRRVESRKVEIKTPLGNTIKSKGCMKNIVTIDTDKTSISKHSTAIAPNLVHSLDSCHLQETVNNMPQDTYFAMIHDSFGCHASDAELLSKTLRQVFYNMYKDGDFLNDFIVLQGFNPEELEVPNKGNLDLSLVLKDEFFFS